MAVSSRTKEDPSENTSGTPEQIAYNLLKDIAFIEKREFRGGPSMADPRITKSWILNTYRECLNVVRGTGVSTGRSVE